MPSHTLSERRRRGMPTKAKAKKILHEGLSSAGDGFHSEAQRKFFGARASGEPVRPERRKRGKKGK